MYRLLVLCGALLCLQSFADGFHHRFGGWHHGPPRRHCHTHPPFHGNPCPGVPDTDPAPAPEFPGPRHPRHCHTHPPFFGNPCPGVTDTDPASAPVFPGPRRPRHCHTHPPFFGNPCPGVMETTTTTTTTTTTPKPQIVPTTMKPDPATELAMLMDEMIARDEKFLNLCQKSVPATQLYGTDAYILKYNLTRPDKSRVTVQIKHKFIHIKMFKPGSDTVLFEDVRTLPDIANAEGADWTYQNGDILSIRVPYNVAFGREAPLKCGEVGRYVIDVPTVVVPDFDYKISQNQVPFNSVYQQVKVDPLTDIK